MLPAHRPEELRSASQLIGGYHEIVVVDNEDARDTPTDHQWPHNYQTARHACNEERFIGHTGQWVGL